MGELHQKDLQAVVEYLAPDIEKKTSLSDIKLHFGFPSTSDVKVDKCILCKLPIKEAIGKIACGDFSSSHGIE